MILDTFSVPVSLNTDFRCSSSSMYVSSASTTSVSMVLLFMFSSMASFSFGMKLNAGERTTSLCAYFSSSLDMPYYSFLEYMLVLENALNIFIVPSTRNMTGGML